MGSKYFGDQNSFGSERSGGLSSSGSSSSSRKGKKNNSDKPKQAQRGLGVAQLEKIRLGCTYLPSVHTPYGSSFSQEDIRLQTAQSSSVLSSSSSPTYGFQGHHGVMMGLPDLDRANITYGDTQSSSVVRWNPGNAGYGTQHFVETRSFIEPVVQGGLNMEQQKGLRSQNSESSDSQDIDLELRL